MLAAWDPRKGKHEIPTEKMRLTSNREDARALPLAGAEECAEMLRLFGGSAALAFNAWLFAA
jgi:hypothetical protein